MTLLFFLLPLSRTLSPPSSLTPSSPRRPSPPRFCAGAPPLIALAQAAAGGSDREVNGPRLGLDIATESCIPAFPVDFPRPLPLPLTPPPSLPLPKPGAVTCGIEEIRSKIPREENNSECVAVNAPRSNPSKAENDTGYKCKAVKKVLISMPHGKQRPGPHVTFRRLKQ